jgi:hypothetical protein
MTSFHQFEANRRNAVRSTGPKTENGKRQSRANAVRHGLTAETVIASLEDTDDYKAFEAAIISDYQAETAVERELVLRLASLLWRLRRATAIETDLLEIQADVSLSRGNEFGPPLEPDRGLAGINRRFGAAIDTASSNPAGDGPMTNCRARATAENQDDNLDSAPAGGATRQLTYCFLRLANLDSGVFERLNRYEAALWRQAVQTLFALQPARQRWSRRLR